MDGKAISVGSFAFWFVWKAATLLVLVFGAAVTFSNGNPYGFILLLIGLAVMAVSNEELVYGRATEDGIHFRRYFNMQFVPWQEINSITWSASDRLQIKLKRGWFLRRTLAAQCFGNSSDFSFREAIDTAGRRALVPTDEACRGGWD